MPLDNFGVVGPYIYRGAQPDHHGIEMLQALKVAVILKLNTAEESDVVEDRPGLVVWRVPIEGVDDPPPCDTVLAIVEKLRIYVAEGVQVYGHCTHGRDRMGFVAAAYEIVVLGRTYKQANKNREAHGVNDAWHRMFNRKFTKALQQLAATGRYT